MEERGGFYFGGHQGRNEKQFKIYHQGSERSSDGKANGEGDSLIRDTWGRGKSGAWGEGTSWEMNTKKESPTKKSVREALAMKESL